MMITKVELENITTHKHTIIEFQHGLNVLIGQNGTGKSTILNMIGFNLFDHLPGNQKDFVREDKILNPKFGIVKVWIVGVNDDLFLIERTLGKQNNTIIVSDARTGINLPGITNKSSFEEWLKTQISVNPEFDLNNIFQTCIGVPQGTFTEPFMRTSQGRKNFFDPILQIDIYRVVWKKLQNLFKLFTEEVHLFEVRTGEIRGFLSIKEDIIKEYEDLKEKVVLTKKEEERLKKRLDQLLDKFEHLSGLKNEIERLNQQYAILNLEKDNLTNSLKNENVQLEQARLADEICSQTKKDYQKYMSLEAESVELNKKNSELQNAKDKKINLEKELVELETNIEDITHRIQEIELLKKSYKKSQEIYGEYESIQQEIEVQLDSLSKISGYIEQFNNYRDKYTNLSISIDQKQKELKDMGKVKKKLESLENLKEEKDKIERNLIELENELKLATLNKSKSENNNCPFLNEPCNNIGDKKLQELFEKQISSIKSLIEKKKLELSPIDKELGDLDQLKMRHEEHNKIILEIDIMKQQKLELGKEIKNVKDSLKNKTSEESKLDELKTIRANLKPQVDKYFVLKEKIEMTLPSLLKTINELEGRRHPLLEKMLPLSEFIMNLEKIPSKLNSITEDMNKLRESYVQFQNNEKVAANLPALQKRVNTLKKSLDKKEFQLHELNERKRKLDQSFDIENYKQVENEKNAINEDYIKVHETIEIDSKRIQDFEQKIQDINKKELELNKLETHIESLQVICNFIEVMRTWYKEASPKITEILIKRINDLASDIFRDLMDISNIDLVWENDYNIKIISNNYQKEFHQLSGGEQMAAALSVRLAILKILTNIDFAFFDEPTTNLDDQKRMNLAKCIQNIKGFNQLFVISHDDTFEENAENVIRFIKDQDEITQVSFLSK